MCLLNYLKHEIKIMYVYALLLFFPLAFLNAAASFTSGVDVTTLAANIKGDGITISNPTIRRHSSNQSGTFTNGINGAGLQIDNGIVLTTGSVNQAFRANSDWHSTIGYGQTANPDGDLANILGNFRAYDTVVFEFDVTLGANTRMLLIEYQFASEEYPEYVGSVFNDAFGFFISGGDLNQTYNVARVVDNQTNMTTENIQSFDIVAVNTVNVGEDGFYANGTPSVLTNDHYYIDNNHINDGRGESSIIIEYDGITVLLQAAVDNLTPGQTYHFKMALADASDAQWDSAVYVKKIQGIRGPDLCYDYGYEQNDDSLIHFSEGSPTPLLKGNVVPNEDINISLYIKNEEVSELFAQNFTIDIFDINTTQVTYTNESVAVVNPNQILKTPIPDGSLTLTTTPTTQSVEDIPLNDLGAEDYAYVYYALEPQTDILDTDIHAVANYNVTLDLGGGVTRTFDYASKLGTDIPMCSGSPLEYEPIWGPFNVGAKGIYTSDNPKFNIPTQISKRPGEFIVTSHDRNDTDYVNEFETNALVAVEMIELGKYNTTGASCDEAAAAISPRFWIPFEEGASVDLNNALENAISEGMVNISEPEDYFNVARQNATFRLVFNTTGDGNNDIIRTEKLTNGKYRMLNFPQLVQDVGICKQPVRIHPYGHNNSSTTWQVAVACGNAGTTGIDLFELNRCSECILGYSTEYVCARDNFAIRPESYNVRLADINQSFPDDTLQHQTFATNRTGVASPVSGTDNIAAGYMYKFDINATNHLNNNATPGYSRNFTTGNANDYNITLIWTPDATFDCNDTSNQILNFYFNNGIVAQRNSAPEIGEYELNIIDSTWTAVDGNLSYMSHHKEALVHNTPKNVSSYFVGSGDALDCEEGESITMNASVLPSISGNSLSNINGCFISSEHNNTDNGLKYRNYEFRIHPYQFGIDLIPSFGMDSNTSFNNAWLYFNRLDDNDSILHSFHLEGLLSAQGHNGAILHNFTTGCFARDINISVDFNSTAIGNTIYTYRWSDDNRTTFNPPLAQNTPELNTSAPIDINATSFTKGDITKLDGEMFFDFYSNIDKNISNPQNPIRITVRDMNITCGTPSECRMQADLNNAYETFGEEDFNRTVTHYYGRVFAPDYRGSSPLTARIYYEVFCDVCDRDDFNITGDLSSQGARWFINAHHNSLAQGRVRTEGVTNGFTSIGNTILGKQETGNNDITNGDETLLLTKNTDVVDRIEMLPDPWLVHNQYDENATTKDFIVEFLERSNWGGHGHVDSQGIDIIGKHVDDNITSERTNRRISW